MFGGGASTEYDDIVNKTTDENLTSENWELILNLCDKVQDEGQPGAHSAIAAILKRLTHRNPNVQLWALSLTEALSKNLGIEIHRELASRAFTQGMEKLITDRNTHEKVRRRALGLIAMWTAEFEKDETLGVMEDCYNSLKAKNYKFEQPQEAAPPTVDDEIRRKEEEELQRVLEMSMQDKGGRNQWSSYSVAGSGSSSSPAAAGSSSSAATRSSATTSTPASSSTSSAHPFAAPKYSGGGYVPARTPSPNTVAAQQRQQQQLYQEQLNKNSTSISATTSSVATPVVTAPTPAAAAAAVATSSNAPSVQPLSANVNIVTRVRALHTFEPTEPGELAFEKGDIIKVVDRGYKDWWRGQLKGRTGIFPVNYVEAMPEPTAAELAKEAEQEAAVFAQAVNVEKLLNMLRAMDPAKDNLADNEEIQELYRSSMALRPKIVKLIDKYSQKRADLVSMNETFVRARTIFDRMMEESLARHSGVYEQPTFRIPQYGQGRPDSRGPAAARRPEYQAGGPPSQAYGAWNVSTPGAEQPVYGAYPGAPGGVGAYAHPGQHPGQPGQQPPPGAYIDPAAAAAVGSPYGVVSPGAQGLPPQQQQQQQQIPSGYGVVPQGGYAGHQPGAPYSQQGPTPYPVQGQQQAQPQPQQQPIQQQQQQPPMQQQPSQQQHIQQPMQAQPFQQPPAQAQQQPAIQQLPIQQQPIQPLPVQRQQPQQPQQQQQQQQQIVPQQQQQPVHAQSEPIHATASSPQPQPQTQPHVQAQAQVQPQLQAEPQPQVQAAPQQPISGPPPYPYDPSYTYADPNVQAWALYYAQGGKDLAGSVYFISIPGVTDVQAAPTPVAQSPVGQQPAQQQQPQETAVRQQSLQAQPQVQQAQAGESQSGYGAVRAISPVQQQQQQQQQPISYQLQDQPAYASAYQQPAQTQPVDITPKQASPIRNYGPGPARQNSAGSPTQASSTPSWVLPKKTGQPAQGQPGTGDSSYFPLTNQMGGMTLTDPGNGSAVSG